MNPVRVTSEKVRVDDVDLVVTVRVEVAESEPSAAAPVAGHVVVEPPTGGHLHFEPVDRSRRRHAHIPAELEPHVRKAIATNGAAELHLVDADDPSTTVTIRSRTLPETLDVLRRLGLLAHGPIQLMTKRAWREELRREIDAECERFAAR